MAGYWEDVALHAWGVGRRKKKSLEGATMYLYLFNEVKIEVQSEVTAPLTRAAAVTVH
jgi:hypothetical protein